MEFNFWREHFHAWFKHTFPVALKITIVKASLLQVLLVSNMLRNFVLNIIFNIYLLWYQIVIMPFNKHGRSSRSYYPDKRSVKKKARAFPSAPLPFLRSDKLFQHYEHLNIYMPLSISKLHLIQLKRQQKQFKNFLHFPLRTLIPPLCNKQRPLMQASALSKCTHKIRPLLGLSWKRNCQANAKQRVAVFPRHVFTSHHLFKATDPL